MVWKIVDGLVGRDAAGGSGIVGSEWEHGVNCSGVRDGQGLVLGDCQGRLVQANGSVVREFEYGQRVVIWFKRHHGGSLQD